MDIAKVRAGIVITELKVGLKFSFRSKGDIYMNEFAKEFNGGGHKNASGARDYVLTLQQAKEKILSLKDKYIK
jgi:phosphoesterase RecJ-like protein